MIEQEEIHSSIEFVRELINGREYRKLSIRDCVARNREAREALSQGFALEAVEIASKALESNCKWAPALHTFACALVELGRTDDALSFFQHCVALDSLHDPSYVAMASIFEAHGDFAKALEILRKLEVTVPGLSEGLFMAGSILLRQGQYCKAREYFDRGLRAPIMAPNSRMLPYGSVSEARLVQDKEQLEWLINVGVLNSDEYETTLEGYRLLLESFPSHVSDDWTEAPIFTLDPESIALISKFYRRTVCIHEAQRSIQPALNRNNDFSEIKRRYFEDPKRPAVVIDNLLSSDTLNSVLNYLYRSTIWHNDAQLGRNYIGAYRQNGLSSPLIEQIAEELKAKLSGIIQGRELIEYWAYRMVMGSSGVGAHADSTEVNVNIWLSPAPENVEKGGLKIYNKIAPKEWGFAKYNADPQSIKSFLSDAQVQCVAYRQNRAVVFNSKLFHETDGVEMHNNYESARVNLTYLFGCGRAKP
jgi:tetratricopeptide (TPR) repeat protein